MGNLKFGFIWFFIIAMATPCEIYSMKTGQTASFGDSIPPAFISEIFEERRDRIGGEMLGDVAIISTDLSDNFYYATGYDQSPAIAIFNPNSDQTFTLFIGHADPTAVLWDGPRYSTEDAREFFGADRAYTLDQFNSFLTNLIREGKSISTGFGDKMVTDILETRISHRTNFNLHTDLSEIIHEMRVIKDNWEQDWIRRAVQVTAESHRRVLQTVTPGQYEYEVKAEIEYIFQKNNCTTGFNSIVGSGPNATYLHYPAYDRQMKDGDLLLIDIGASCNHYTADVTRTIPVNGKFSPEQRELYELILNAQEKAIELMEVGNGTLEPHHIATEIIMDGLLDLGLITDHNSWWQKRFYTHYAGLHYIGLYVHDVGHFADFERSNRDYYVLNTDLKGRPLEEGMVITIEPGIYLEENRMDHIFELLGRWATEEELCTFVDKVGPVYQKYSGIGIRIEDDVLITQSGPVILSDGAPKHVEEIEKAMRQRD